MKFPVFTLTRALLMLVALTSVVAAQQPTPPQTAAPNTTAPAAAATGITAASTPIELARAAFNAQGGEKFRALKNMMLIGSADMYSPSSTQSLAGKFGLIMAGDRARLNIQTPLFQLETIFDGDRSYNSMRQFPMPPVNKYGLPVLAKFDQPGYAVSALPDKKKERAFRITDPDGHVTDYYVDATTGRLIRYEILLNGLTFSVEHTKLQEVEGVLVPVNSVWKLDAPTGAYYAEFKAKEVKLNQTLPDNAFAIPGQ